MTARLTPLLALACLVTVTTAAVAAPAATPAETTAATAPVSRDAIVGAMRRVADWQIAKPSRHATTDWTQAPYFSGLLALYRVSGDKRYLDAVVGFGEKNAWKLGPRRDHADDHAVGKAYAEIHALNKDPKVIADMRRVFDAIIAKPPANPEDLVITKKGGLNKWSWCDALYMSPPAFMALSAATGDAKYLDYADREFRRTQDFLYDKEHHLFYRDSKYMTLKEANGRPIFWGRGNGWVIAGLADILKVLPKQHPSRPHYEKLLAEMTAALAALQQPDGAWRTSLLDPASYPSPEMSSTALISYGMAYAVNTGVVDRARFRPVLDRSWAALVAHIRDDGRLGSVQPIGETPKSVSPEATEVYGNGAFLQFGEEYLKLVGAK